MTFGRLLLLWVMAIVGAFPLHAQQSYFVDASGGNDSLDGRSEMTAWRSLEKVSGTTFAPGDSIRLKRGSVWGGYLAPKGSGLPGLPIVISTYGEGVLPVINTAGSYLTALLLWNQQYWEVEHIEISNLHPSNTTGTRYGVYVLANNSGPLTHIVLRNLVVRDVNANPGSKTCGGIFFEVSGGATVSWFDSVLVEGCDVRDLSPVGIATTSNWSNRTLTTNSNWYPSTHMVFRNNTIRRTVRNGMIVRVAEAPIIEHNVFQECGKDSSGNAVFVFNCDGAVLQYNEAFLTRYNAGDEDAGGFDGDYRCRNTLIQYNYSHDNEYGGIVVVSDGGGTNTFNDGAVVRYNVLKDNLNHCIRISGNVTNTRVYNNTIFSGSAVNPVVAVWHKSWGGYCSNTAYTGNIFELQRYGSSFQFGSSTNTQFDHNLFHGIRAAGEPTDSHKVTADPKFADVGSVGNGWGSAAGLSLLESSPAINNGVRVAGHALTDYLGNEVPHGAAVDIGAFEFQGPDAVEDPVSLPALTPRLDAAYPNPFNPRTTIRFALAASGDIVLRVSDLLGRWITTIAEGRHAAGEHTVTFDAENLPSGVYVITLQAGTQCITTKALLLR